MLHLHNTVSHQKIFNKCWICFITIELTLVYVKSRLEGWLIPKTVLDAALLNTHHYKVRIKGGVEQSRERSSTPPTPRCSRYWKGSLQVTLDYGHQLLIYIYIYIYIYISSRPSKNIRCVLFMYRIYEEFHINQWECSMYSLCYIFLFQVFKIRLTSSYMIYILFIWPILMVPEQNILHNFSNSTSIPLNN